MDNIDILKAVLAKIESDEDTELVNAFKLFIDDYLVMRELFHAGDFSKTELSSLSVKE